MLQEYGSIPTNPLVASARGAAHVARSANDYGVITGGSSAVDMNKVEERTDAVARRSSESMEKCLKGTEYVMVYEGYARSLTQMARPHSFLI